jgi:hypothetical protein
MYHHCRRFSYIFDDVPVEARMTGSRQFPPAVAFIETTLISSSLSNPLPELLLASWDWDARAVGEPAAQV